MRHRRQGCSPDAARAERGSGDPDSAGCGQNLASDLAEHRRWHRDWCDFEADGTAATRFELRPGRRVVAVTCPSLVSLSDRLPFGPAPPAWRRASPRGPRSGTAFGGRTVMEPQPRAHVGCVRPVIMAIRARRRQASGARMRCQSACCKAVRGGNTGCDEMGRSSPRSASVVARSGSSRTTRGISCDTPSSSGWRGWGSMRGWVAQRFLRYGLRRRS